MGKYFLIAVVLFIINSGTFPEAQSAPESAFPDSVATFDHCTKSIPDSLKISADSLNVLCKTDFKMPMFKADPEKTDSMPQYKAPKIDEGILIPWLSKCSDNSTLLKKNN